MNLHVGGVYLIRCIPTGEIYVGESADIFRRWRDHRAYLNNQTHANIDLQALWNRYGKTAFHVEVLEEVSAIDDLECREQHWIKHYHGQSAELLLNRMALPGKNGILKREKSPRYKFPVELSDELLSKLDDLVRERQSRFPGAVRRVDVIRKLIECEWGSMSDQGRIRAKSPA